MPGRFFPIFYLAHGQTDTQIGLLIAAPQLVSLLAVPFFCNLADRLGRHEHVAALTFLAAMVCFLAQLIALPKLDLLSASARFPVLMIFGLLFGVLSSPAYSLVSAMTIAQLREEHGENGHEYFGTERLWGAVSWAVCALGLGFVLDLRHVDVSVVYVGIVLFGSTYVLILLRFESFQSKRNTPESDNKEYGVDDSLLRNEHRSASDEVEVGGLVAEEDIVEQESCDVFLSALKAYYDILISGGPSTFMFFHLIIWLNAGMSLVENLLFLFFQKDLHASNLLCGISVVVTVIFEIPIFAQAPKLLPRIGSTALAIIGSLAFVVRGIGYGVAPNGWFALLIEPLHGVTIGAVATASVSFVAERTPPELEATGQSLLDVIHRIAFTFGTAAGGYVMQKYGAKTLYKGAAILVLAATAAFAIVNWSCPNREVRLQAIDRTRYG